MAEEVRYEVKLDGIDGFQKGLGALENSVNSFESTLGGIKNTMLGLFAVDKLIDFGKSLVDTGAKFEAYEIGLGTLLHSEKAAHEAFEQIKKDASSTPFDTDSLIMANRALISAGSSAEEARQVVLDLGNAISATGGGSAELSNMAVNLQQIKNLGKASALDIKQFAFAGINVYEALAKSTGKSIDSVKNMSVSYEVLTKALKDAHSAGGIYEGGLEKMGKSTQVQISNLEDMVTFLKVDIFNAIKPGLNSAMQAVGEIMGALKDSLPQIIETFKPIWIIIKDIGSSLMNMLKPIANAFKNIFGLVMEIIEPIKNDFAPLIQIISDGVIFILDAFEGLMPILKPLFHIIGEIAHVILTLGMIIGNTIMKFIEWLSHTRIFKAVWDSIVFVLEKTVGFIDKIVGGIKSLLGIKDDSSSKKENKTTAEKLQESKEGLSSYGGNKISGGIQPTSKAGSVTGTKQVIINVSIAKLVETIKIMPASMKDSVSDIEKHITNALLGATNQFSASADI